MIINNPAFFFLCIWSFSFRMMHIVIFSSFYPFLSRFTSLQLAGWLLGAFATVLQSVSGRLPEREKEKRNNRREKKMSKQPPLAPTASVVGPCPTLIQISKTPLLWKFTQHHCTTRPTPTSLQGSMDISGAG